MRARFALLPLGALALVACQPPPDAAPSDVGSVSLQLKLGNSYRFNTVHYAIDGVAYHTAADVDVANSATFTTVVGAVPFGHYTAQLTANDVDGKLMPCAGSAAFDVTSETLLAVPIHLTCREAAPPPTGVPSVPVPRGATIALGLLLAVLGAARARGRRTLATLTLAVAVSAGGASGCATEATEAASDADAGSVHMALVVAPGITLNTIAFRITGPGMFTKQGSINVANSTTVSRSVAPLPAGNNFTLEMQADGTDGLSMCQGSAVFDIVARQTTSVVVHMFCKQPPRTVGVALVSPVNFCPLIDSLGASPAEALVGSSIALTAIAHDTDAVPAPMAYHWTAIGGTLSNPSVQSPVLTCAAPGTASVTLTVDDGELAAGCPDTQTITVTCTAVAP